MSRTKASAVIPLFIICIAAVVISAIFCTRTEQPAKALSLNTEIKRIENLIDLGKDCTYTAASVDSSFANLVHSVLALLASAKTAQDTVAVFNRCILQDRGILFEDNRTDLCLMMPSTVLDERRGSCLGISLVYLLVAEQTGVPLHGVVVPGHFFVRLDNGKERLNIETMQQGRTLPDQWYREKFVKERGDYDLHNLTNKEIIGVVYYNIGNLFSYHAQFTLACGYLDASTREIPWLAEAWGNLGVAQVAAGRAGEALRTLYKAKSIDATLPCIDKDIGTVLLKTGNFPDALRQYRMALRLSPEDPEVLLGLASSSKAMGHSAAAVSYLKSALALHPGYAPAQDLLDEIPSPATEYPAR